MALVAYYRYYIAQKSGICILPIDKVFVEALASRGIKITGGSVTHLQQMHTVHRLIEHLARHLRTRAMILTLFDHLFAGICLQPEVGAAIGRTYARTQTTSL